MEIEVPDERFARVKDVNQMPDLDFLKDEKLNCNGVFSELRRKLEDHFMKPKCMHQEKSPRWRSILYNSLLTCLREVTFESDPNEQSSMLDRVQKWYKKKTERPTSVSSVKPPPRTALSPMPFDHPRIELKKSEVVKPIEGKSLSPARLGLQSPQAWVPRRDTDLAKPFVTPPGTSSLIQGNLLQRFHDYQMRKVKQLRSVIVDRKNMSGWSRGKSRHEEDSTFITEQSLKLSSRDTSPLRTNTSIEWQKQTTSLMSVPSPLLVDLRSDYASTKTPTSTTAESTVERVARFRQRHAELLNVSEESPARTQKYASISMYRSQADSFTVEVKRPRTPSHTPIAQRPESRPIQASSLSPLRRSRIMEINEVKRKLAQANMPCTFRVLKDGLMEPESLPASMLTPQSLPQGGELLQSNPFFFAGKKKKKLKRKK